MSQYVFFIFIIGMYGAHITAKPFFSPHKKKPREWKKKYLLSLLFQAKIHYLDIISGLPSYGAKCFSTNQRDGVERVLLISPRFGLSQIAGVRNSVVSKMKNFFFVFRFVHLLYKIINHGLRNEWWVAWIFCCYIIKSQSLSLFFNEHWNEVAPKAIGYISVLCFCLPFPSEKICYNLLLTLKRSKSAKRRRNS